MKYMDPIVLGMLAIATVGFLILGAVGTAMWAGIATLLQMRVMFHQMLLATVQDHINQLLAEHEEMAPYCGQSGQLPDPNYPDHG